MGLRVVQWSVGSVGRCSLRALLRSDDFDVVGLYTHAEGRAGRDAGELASLGIDTGVPTLFWGGMVRMLAEILDVELDGLEEFCDRWYAPDAFDVPIGRIERGTLAAVRFGVAGIVGGERRLFADHVTRMRHDAA